MRYLVLATSLLLPGLVRADNTPLVTKGPITSGVSQVDAWVAWETAHHEGTGTECTLEALLGTPNTNTPTLTLTPAGTDGSSFSDTACSEDHLVHVTGLSPGSTYTFTLDMTWDDGNPVQAQFLTAPPSPPDSFSFVVYGDVRDGDTDLGEPSTEANHQALVNAILSNEGNAQFLINSGDLALNLPLISGDDDGYTEYFDVERLMLANWGLYTSIGNHETISTTEYDTLVNAPGFEMSSHPYYSSMDWGQVHVTFLDSFEGPTTDLGFGGDSPEITDAQAQWVASDLAAASAAGQLMFIVAHQGPFSHSNDSSAHGGSPDFDAKILPLMIQYGVLASFAGHDHYYQRGHEGCIDYIVAGGGGAPMYEPDGTAAGVAVALEETSYVEVNVTGLTASLIAKDINGNAIDTFTFQAPSPSACAAETNPDAGGPTSGTSSSSGSASSASSGTTTAASSTGSGSGPGATVGSSTGGVATSVGSVATSTGGVTTFASSTGATASTSAGSSTPNSGTSSPTSGTTIGGTVGGSTSAGGSSSGLGSTSGSSAAASTAGTTSGSASPAPTATAASGGSGGSTGTASTKPGGCGCGSDGRDGLALICIGVAALGRRRPRAAV